jgi:thymidylate kinase
MKRRKDAGGLLVCFTGIDGSGKSTLARALAVNLEAQGIRCS